MIGHRRLVRLPENPARPSVGDGGEHLVPVDSVLLQDLTHHRLVAQIPSLVVTGGEQGDVDVEEPIGELLPHHQPGLDRRQIGRLLLEVPDRGPALLDVGLGQ